jgi:hypothetical protein
MTRRTIIRVVLALFVAFGVATFTRAGLSLLERGARKSSGDPCSSVEDARRFGTLIYRIEFDPATVVIDGERIGCREGWVEVRSDPSHWLVWVPTRERLEGYNLVLIPEPAHRGAWTWMAAPDARVFLHRGDPTTGSRVGDSMLTATSGDRVLYFTQYLDSVETLPDRVVFSNEFPKDPGFQLLGEIRLRYVTP